MVTNPLALTRQTLKEDVRWMKERLACDPRTRPAQRARNEVAHVRDELDILLASSTAAGTRRSTCRCSCAVTPLGAGLTALAFTLAAAGSVGLTHWRRRRRARLTRRAGRLSPGDARMTEHPERVATESTIPAKIVTAAASAAVAALVKKLLERGVAALANGRQPPGPCGPAADVRSRVGRGCNGSPNCL